MPNKYRITQSLLSSWLWVYRKDTGYEEFLRALRRERTPQTAQMLDGIQFENIINACLDGAELDMTHKWAKPISEIVPELMGAQKQVSVFRDIVVDGVPFVLHGILDFLKAGVIYDTKFSKSYRVGKYLESPQHPMYFALVPEAYEFQYIISDGSWVYHEVYRPEDAKPIENTIREFMAFLDRNDLVDLYADKWRIKK